MKLDAENNIPDTFNCQFCGKECKNKNSLAQHEIRCKYNPNRIKVTLKGNPTKGRIPWNKGLTKATDSRVKRGAERLSVTMTGLSTGKASTPEKERLRREKISKWAKESHLGELIEGSGRGKKGKYKGYYCDSTYELVYIIYNLDNNIPFKRCKRSYHYTYNDNNYKYYPDFELDDGSLVEIKGYHTPQVDAKLNAVTDRKIKVLYYDDLQYAFNWVKNNYSYNSLTDLYDI